MLKLTEMCILQTDKENIIDGKLHKVFSTELKKKVYILREL